MITYNQIKCQECIWICWRLSSYQRRMQGYGVTLSAVYPLLPSVDKHVGVVVTQFSSCLHSVCDRPERACVGDLWPLPRPNPSPLGLLHKKWALTSLVDFHLKFCHTLQKTWLNGCGWNGASPPFKYGSVCCCQQHCPMLIPTRQRCAMDGHTQNDVIILVRCAERLWSRADTD